MQKILICVVIVILCNKGFAAIKIARTTTPSDALASVASDIAKTDEVNRPYQLYIWGLSSNKEEQRSWHRVVNWINNTCVSKSSNILYPSTIDSHVLRFDIRDLLRVSNGEIDTLFINNIVKDPFFYEKGSHGSPSIGVRVVSSPHGASLSSVTVNGPAYLAGLRDNDIIISVNDFVVNSSSLISYIQNGSVGANLSITYQRQNRLYNCSIIVGQSNLKKKNTSTFALASHLRSRDAYLTFFKGIGSKGLVYKDYPYNIISARYFLELVSTQTINGKYYDFVGISGKNKNQIIKELGANPDISANVGALRHWAIIQSQVTGKWRIIQWFQGIVGPIFVTLDFTDDQTESKDNPFYQLLNVEKIHKAEEMIAQRPNGSHLFALFNGEGELVNVAPSETVAIDTTVINYKKFGTARLEPAKSCITCHMSDGGIKPIETVLSPTNLRNLDIFDDTSTTSQRNAVEQLTSLYGRAADLLETKNITSRARVDYNLYCLKSTKGLETKEISQEYQDIIFPWLYNLVNPTQAVLEMGYIIEDGDPVEIFNRLLPVHSSKGIAIEDNTIGFLKSGISVQRSSWNEILPYVLLRKVDLHEQNLK